MVTALKDGAAQFKKDYLQNQEVIFNVTAIQRSKDISRCHYSET